MSDLRYTVWKFDLGPTPIALPFLLRVQMPKGARPVKVGEQAGLLFLWAIVDPCVERVSVPIVLVGTGQPSPSNGYVETVLVHDQWVIHVFVGEGAAA